MTLAPPKVKDAQKRMARYYQKRLKELATTYKEGEVKYALERYDAESSQIERILYWVDAYPDKDADIAWLFVQFLVDGSTLFMYRLDTPHLLELCQRALHWAKYQNREVDVLELHMTIANSYSLLGHYQISIDSFQDSLAIAQKLGQKVQMAQISFNVGEEHMYLGLPRETIQYAHSSLQLFTDLKMKPNMCLSLTLLAFSSVMQGQWERAKDYLDNAYVIAQTITDRYALLKLYTTLGTFYGSTGDYKQAQKYFLQAYHTAKLYGDPRVTAELLNLGMLHIRIQQYEKAEAYLLESLSIHQKYGIQQEIDHLLTELGNLYFARKDYIMARKYMEEAFHHAKQVKNYSILSKSIAFLVEIYVALGQYQHAHEAIEVGLKFAVESKTKKYQISLIIATIRLYLSIPEIPQPVMRQAISWIGTVYHLPYVEPAHRDNLASLRPQMEAIASQQEIQRVFSEPSDLPIEHIIDEIQNLSI